MTDLASNLEYLSNQVDHTLTKGVPFKNEDKLLEDEIRQELSKNIEASNFAKPSKLSETLRQHLSEDDLLDLYEKHVDEVGNMSGKPTSPRDSQWYVNPNHLETTCEAPTLQSIGKTYRYGEKSRNEYADRDRVAHNYFPVTLGSSYKMCALDYPASYPMNYTAPPSMRSGRSKSATRLGRSKTFRTPDRSFKITQDIDKLYFMTREAPTIGKYSDAIKHIRCLCAKESQKVAA